MFNVIHCAQSGALDPLFMSIDANFRLCRREKAGSASKEDVPIYKAPFFLPQRDVDSYISSQQGLVSYTWQVRCAFYINTKTIKVLLGQV